MAKVERLPSQTLNSSFSRSSDLDLQRLIAKVAWMYHIRKLSQKEIAEVLSLSQARVSRFLEQAKASGVVRTEVILPLGLYADLESELEALYGLKEAHVFDANYTVDESELIDDLGRLLGARLLSNGINANVIGFTSWSRSLRSTVLALQNLKDSAGKIVVEMLGDVGNPAAQHEAALATQHLAEILHAEPVFLRVPGVVESKEMRDLLLKQDPHVQEALRQLDRVELALVGIGTCEIVPPLTPGDNFFTEKQFAQARKDGAVGQVNLRFIDKFGNPVKTELDNLVVGITLDQLKRANRSIGVAGGPSKFQAIRASIRGGWVNTLATDVETAKWLIVNSTI